MFEHCYDENQIKIRNQQRHPINKLKMSFQMEFFYPSTKLVIKSTLLINSLPDFLDHQVFSVLLPFGFPTV